MSILEEALTREVERLVREELAKQLAPMVEALVKQNSRTVAVQLATDTGLEDALAEEEANPLVDENEDLVITEENFDAVVHDLRILLKRAFNTGRLDGEKYDEIRRKVGGIRAVTTEDLTVEKVVALRKALIECGVIEHGTI